MNTLLKIIGWIFVFIAVVGGPQVIVSEGFSIITLIVELFFIALAWLCFWGAKRLEK